MTEPTAVTIIDARTAAFYAPVHILAFCDTSGVVIEDEWKAIDMLHCIQSATIACQNILLAAKAMNLGSLWMGAPIVVEKEIKIMLQAPQDVQLMAIIAIGYPADQPLPPVRKPLSKIMFLENWQKK